MELTKRREKTAVLDSNVNINGEFQLAGTTNYTYDGNGSMTSRLNTNTAANYSANNLGAATNLITYNILSLPATVPTTTGSGTLNYVYDAGGNKLRMTGTNRNFDYIGGVHYENGAFAFAQTEVGRVTRNGTGADAGYLYEYTLTDHLGNGRLYFDISGGVARKIQELEYYAFGKSISVGSVLGSENRYQYNGKEK